VGGICTNGRASVPMMPQRVHTMRGPNDGTGTSSGCAHDRPVVALPATHVERPHAVGADVAEGHRRPCLRWCASAEPRPCDLRAGGCQGRASLAPNARRATREKTAGHPEPGERAWAGSGPAGSQARRPTTAIELPAANS
jgi:hypothetical protein